MPCRSKSAAWGIVPLSILWLASIYAFGADSSDRADDWTRFRGPNGSGVSKTPFNDPIGRNSFLWKIDLPGIGHSSPVVRGDHLYVTSGDPDSGKRIVLCLNPKDGTPIWKREYDSRAFTELHRDNAYASATPAVDEVGVYICWPTPESLTLIALDHTGKDLWKQDLGRFVSQHGGGASPIVVDDLVILTDDQEGKKSLAAAFDHRTGAVRWQIDRRPGNKTALSTPCLFRPKGGLAQLVLTSKANGVTSLDPRTGKVNWQVPGACPDRTVGSPVVTDDLVIANSGEGSSTRTLVAIRPGAPASEPAVAYKLSEIPPYVPTPLIKGELMFLWGDNGVVTCVKAATGQTVWSERLTGSSFYGSPICAGDTMWAMSQKGKLIGVAAADKFRLISETDLGERSQSTPAVAGGRMYLRTLSHLFCVRGRE